MTSEEYRHLKAGDRLRLARWNGYHGKHFKQNGVYTVGVLTGSGFRFATCESKDNCCAAGCCSGNWSLFTDWEYADLEEPPITSDEAVRAVPLPPVEDVARFFGV